MNEDLRTTAWDRSYDRRENFLFYPHEEIVRFMARYVRKRVGFEEFEDRHGLDGNPKVLDLGCGIGRHVRFCDDLGLDAWGVDHSRVALVEAGKIVRREGRSHLAGRFVVANGEHLPFSDHAFDFIVSHGVLDSMPFDVARRTVRDCRRILSASGRFYLDLISGDDDHHFPEFAGEEVVSTAHERDTVQSYFNYARIQALVGDGFAIEECQKVTRASVVSAARQARYHVVLAVR